MLKDILDRTAGKERAKSEAGIKAGIEAKNEVKNQGNHPELPGHLLTVDYIKRQKLKK